MKLKLTWLLTLCMAFMMQFSFAQEKTVSGTVTSEADGLPLPGVNVIVKNTSRGAQTDFDGIYSINASEGEILVFSFVGMKTVEITVGANNTINLTMQEDAESLDEVVVVAYGTEKASNVTSAISVVKSESIEQVPNASLDQVLQGQAAGLNIQTSSGQPGASGTIILRGRNSVQGNIEPLFVIDGVPVNEDNFRSLNSNDIENVSVLKDASASALYGNRAAGGVIIVTTKKGKKGSGVNIQYRSLYGVSDRIDPGFDLMNAQQYLTYQRSRGLNSLSDAEISAIAAQTNTDWEELFFRQGDTNSHEVNISTGTERTTTFSSVSYFEQEGITRRSNLKRFTFRNNTSTTSSNDKFNFNTNLTLGYSKNDQSSNPGSGQLDNPFINAYIGNPALNPFNPDGSLDIFGDGTTGFANSPIVALNQSILNTDNTDELKIVGNIAASLEIFKNIRVGGSVGMDYEQTNRVQRIDPTSLRGINNDTNNPTAALIFGSQANTSFRDATFNVNSSISYSNIFNEKHSLDVSVFTEYFKEHISSYGFEAFGLDPKLPFVSAGFTSGNTTEGPATAPLYNYIPTVTATLTDGGLFSYFGVVKYDYDNKYGLQASIRRDASSRFSKTNKWGTFWSVSAKWNIHNEKFMEGNTFFNDLKLRASYGTTGNDRAAARFGSFSLVGTAAGGNTNGSTQGYQGTTGYWVTQVNNPDLKWETVVQANIGLDYSIWDRRISGSLDVYHKTTEDLFLNQPISTISGFNSINANVGEMVNKGIELSVNYDIIRNNDPRDFQWSVNGNIAYNKNEITKLVGDGLIETTRTALSEGDPFGSFYAVRWAGVNPANGSPLYLDLDGNITETYTADNRVILDKTQDPRYVGGFGTNVSYGGFALNALFSYAAEQYRYNGSLAVVEDPTLVTISNQATSILREWTQPGDMTDIPAPGFGSTRLLLTDRYIEDASFLRLRNVTLSYTVDRDVLEKTNIFTGIRIYAQGQNLLTFTKWRGFDPESNINSTFFEFPTPRTYTVGVDINF
ncbi:SusC/RagA family TonB-linked outer membrane protein [Winogradskyella sp. 3972H.M.0a.05]|uniref:SusC/RagA family TonB-linked outer membrane protein n=1 Tax=Winogradskyella sp. 3972H.M.0a.05 TaxID=2950277 RepID=UPI003395F977